MKAFWQIAESCVKFNKLGKTIELGSAEGILLIDAILETRLVFH